MTTKISSDNIQPSTLAVLGSGPKITQIQVTDSSYTPTGANTISTSGGYIKITGTGFNGNCNVVFGNVNATSVSFVGANVLNAQVPALPASSYIVYVVDTSKGQSALKINGITVA